MRERARKGKRERGREGGEREGGMDGGEALFTSYAASALCRLTAFCGSTVAW